jgi:hypothetical protein
VLIPRKAGQLMGAYLATLGARCPLLGVRTTAITGYTHCEHLCQPERFSIIAATLPKAPIWAAPSAWHISPIPRRPVYMGLTAARHIKQSA